MDNQQIVSNPVPTPNNYGGYGYDPAPSRSYGSSSMIKTAALAIVSFIALGLIVLSIYLFSQLNDARTDVEGQVNEAVAIKVNEKITELENEFTEREKQPFRNFLGPVDYGELSFEYPKTWSLYIARDAANGGDYEAYMNPVEIQAISNTTVYALRIFIYNTPFENVAESYNGALSNGTLSLKIEDLGNNVTINVYTGTLNNGFNGKMALLKIRDKTVLLQTDSQLFAEDFDRILSTIKYNA